jgi:hypothetical protein
MWVCGWDASETSWCWGEGTYVAVAEVDSTAQWHAWHTNTYTSLSRHPQRATCLPRPPAVPCVALLRSVLQRAMPCCAVLCCCQARKASPATSDAAAAAAAPPASQLPPVAGSSAGKQGTAAAALAAGEAWEHGWRVLGGHTHAMTERVSAVSTTCLTMYTVQRQCAVDAGMGSSVCTWCSL